ncbi:Uncharacterised protein [Raoultella ornithinolytica]|nr:Uncharacterised protein [Raoultella ornithinolytica]
MNKQAAAQGVLIYCLRRAIRLAERFEPERVPDYRARLQQLCAAVQERLWDEKQGFYVSGAQRQVSWASQIWLVLAEVGSAGQRREIMHNLRRHPPAIAMNTPICAITISPPCCSAGSVKKPLPKSRPTGAR